MSGWNCVEYYNVASLLFIYCYLFGSFIVFFSCFVSFCSSFYAFIIQILWFCSKCLSKKYNWQCRESKMPLYGSLLTFYSYSILSLLFLIKRIVSLLIKSNCIENSFHKSAASIFFYSICNSVNFLICYIRAKVYNWNTSDFWNRVSSVESF